MSTNSGAKITALIVTFNSREHIGPALDALLDPYQDGELACVVVDNASVDGTADFVEGNYPWVELVRSLENLGFGRGCNFGFERIRTPYVLLHNPDAVIDYRSIKTLLDFMESRNEAGIVAPSLVYEEGVHQSVGMMTTPASLLRGVAGQSRTMPEARSVAPRTPAFQTNWVCGAMMLMRSDLYRRLGGFDPRFFLYFEETDLCRRVTSAGLEIWSVGEAIAQHVGAASAKASGQILAGSCIPEHYYRSRFYYLVKHFGWFRATITELLDWAATKARRLRDQVMGRSRNADSRSGRPLLRLPEKPDRYP